MHPERNYDRNVQIEASWRRAWCTGAVLPSACAAACLVVFAWSDVAGAASARHMSVTFDRARVEAAARGLSASPGERVWRVDLVGVCKLLVFGTGSLPPFVETNVEVGLARLDLAAGAATFLPSIQAHVAMRARGATQSYLGAGPFKLAADFIGLAIPLGERERPARIVVGDVIRLLSGAHLQSVGKSSDGCAHEYPSAKSRPSRARPIERAAGLPN